MGGGSNSPNSLLGTPLTTWASQLLAQRPFTCGVAKWNADSRPAGVRSYFAAAYR